MKTSTYSNEIFQLPSTTQCGPVWRSQRTRKRPAWLQQRARRAYGSRWERSRQLSRLLGRDALDIVVAPWRDTSDLPNWGRCRPWWSTCCCCWGKVYKAKKTEGAKSCHRMILFFSEVINADRQNSRRCIQWNYAFQNCLVTVTVIGNVHDSFLRLYTSLQQSVRLHIPTYRPVIQALCCEVKEKEYLGKLSPVMACREKM